MADYKGEFVWYDLMTTNVADALTFYTEAIGWGTQLWEGGDKPYTMLTRNGEAIGGLMDLPEDARKMGAPPHWMAYVGTPDVDATVAQAKELGATLYFGPMDIPEVGRFAILADPFGAVFAAFTAADQMSGNEGDPLEFSWHELMTTDPEAAWSFYSALFGWKKTRDIDMGGDEPYAMFAVKGDKNVGGVMTKPDQVPMSCWLFYVHVTDLDATLKKIEAGGGKVVAGPMEVPGGDRVATCTDPQGGTFGLYSPTK